MEVRAIEYRPVNYLGWSYLSQAQLVADMGSQTAPSSIPIETPDALKSQVSDQFNLDKEPYDTIRIVFGAVTPDNAADLAKWLRAISEDLSDVDEIANTLCDPTNRDLVFASLPRQSYNLFRLRVSIPRFVASRAEVTWYPGTIAVIESMLIVLWHSGPDDDARACAQIDARARRGQYLPDELPSASTLASSYAVETASAIHRTARYATGFVDQWEAELFTSAPDHSEDPKLARLGSIRSCASAMQGKLDALTSQITPGLWRRSWSSADHDQISNKVDRSIDDAGNAVLRLRHDVSDAFVAASTVAISRQLAASQEQEMRVGRLQTMVTRLTAFLLVPGLVAAVFGTNVVFPSSDAFAMLALMVVGAIVTYLVLHRVAERA